MRTGSLPDQKLTSRSCFFPDFSQWKRFRIIRGRSLLDDLLFFTGHSEGIFLNVRRIPDAYREPSGWETYLAALTFSGRQLMEKIPDHTRKIPSG
jgi:hypothetical protein